MTAAAPQVRDTPESPYAGVRRGLALAASAFVLLEVVVLVLGLAVVGRHGGGAIQGWDNTVQAWWINHRAHLVRGSKVIAVLGDAPALGLISVVLTAILLALRQKQRAFVPLVAYLGGEAMVFLTREVVHRHRPPTADYPAPHAIPGVHETSFSYPSGHGTAAVAVLISLAVLVVLWRRANWSWLLAGLLIVASAAVACSRLVLGVHWFSDVTFGMLVGIPWGIVVPFAIRQLPWRPAESAPGEAARREPDELDAQRA